MNKDLYDAKLIEYITALSEELPGNGLPNLEVTLGLERHLTAHQFGEMQKRMVSYLQEQGIIPQGGEVDQFLLAVSPYLETEKIEARFRKKPSRFNGFSRHEIEPGNALPTYDFGTAKLSLATDKSFLSGLNVQRQEFARIERTKHIYEVKVKIGLSPQLTSPAESHYFEQLEHARNIALDLLKQY